VIWFPHLSPQPHLASLCALQDTVKMQLYGIFHHGPWVTVLFLDGLF